jgi:hypothetical protein
MPNINGKSRIQWMLLGILAVSVSPCFAQDSQSASQELQRQQELQRAQEAEALRQDALRRAQEERVRRQDELRAQEELIRRQARERKAQQEAEARCQVLRSQGRPCAVPPARFTDPPRRVID